MEENVTEGVRTLLGDPRKAVLKISVPMMIAMFVSSMYNVADAVWVSGLGSNALAAVGLFFPFFMMIIALASGIGVGGSSAISRRIGERNKEAADNTAIHTFVVGIAIAGAVSLPFIPFLNQIFVSMGSDVSVAGMASRYARILFGGSIFLFLSYIGNAILRGEGDAKRAMYAMVIGSALNIILDPVFIYTFKLGVAGAAWATLISMVISFIPVAYWLFVKKDTYVDMSLKDFRPDRKIAKEIFRVGVPASLAQLSMSIAMFGLNWIILGVGGDDGIAIFTSGWRVTMIGIIPLLGMAIGVTAVTGAAYGARDMEKLEAAYLYGIKIGMGVEIVVAVSTAIFAPQIAYLFTYSEGSASLYGELVNFLRWMVLFYITTPLGMLTSSMFNGIGKGERALTVTVLRTIILQIAMAYLFAMVLDFGLTGVWMGIVTGNVTAALVSFTWGKMTVSHLKKDMPLPDFADGKGQRD
ncbi:MAG: MATE family efflux transporter [Thermoplasmata archaeon]|nr:MAG: MATE family efflux transporter [Thermoplasmata archaeon]